MTRRILPAALGYVTPVFAAGVLLGTVRVTVLAPFLGPVPAVALELPFLLAVSWLVAGRVLCRWPLDRPGRLAMGALALALLLLAELALALALGQPARAFVAALATPSGALGLAGQAVFALIPALRA